MGNVNMELPRYNHTHREVYYALQIGEIEYHADGGATITPVEDGYEPVHVYPQFMKANQPEEGGYYVVTEGTFHYCLSADYFEKHFITAPDKP